MEAKALPDSEPYSVLGQLGLTKDIFAFRSAEEISPELRKVLFAEPPYYDLLKSPTTSVLIGAHPGAGKTMSRLKIAEEYIDEFLRTDVQVQVPLVLNINLADQHLEHSYDSVPPRAWRIPILRAAAHALEDIITLDNYRWLHMSPDTRRWLMDFISKYKAAPPITVTGQHRTELLSSEWIPHSALEDELATLRDNLQTKMNFGNLIIVFDKIDTTTFKSVERLLTYRPALYLSGIAWKFFLDMRVYQKHARTIRQHYWDNFQLRDIRMEWQQSQIADMLEQRLGTGGNSKGKGIDPDAYDVIKKIEQTASVEQSQHGAPRAFLSLGQKWVTQLTQEIPNNVFPAKDQLYHAFYTVRNEFTHIKPSMFEDKWEGKFHLIVVGVNQYANRVLEYAVADAEGFFDRYRSYLRHLPEVHEAHDGKKELLRDEKATYESIRILFEAVAKDARPRDTFFFFFAGHGRTLTTATGHSMSYLWLTESSLRNPEETAISNTVLQTWLDAIPCANKVCFLDACHAGSFTRSAEEEEVPRGAKLTDDFDETITKDWQTATLAASGPGELARESEHRKHGVFTYHLLAGLDRGNPKSVNPNNGSVTVYTLWSYIKSEFEKESIKNLASPFLNQKGQDEHIIL